MRDEAAVRLVLKGRVHRDEAAFDIRSVAGRSDALDDWASYEG